MRTTAFIFLLSFSLWGAGCAQTECAHLTDCSSGFVCSADGACIESEAPVLTVSRGRDFSDVDVGDGGGDGDGDAGDDGDDGEGDDALDLPPLPELGIQVIDVTRVQGNIGGTDVNDEAFLVVFDGRSFSATTPASAFVALNGNDLVAVLTTPGTRRYAYDANDVNGLACTSTYDEPAYGGVEVVVSEPDDTGTVTVELTEWNDNTNVTVTTGFSPI